MKFILVMTILTILLQNGASGTSVWTFIHDLIQNNVAGIPAIHEKTEWDFDPEVGKSRRIQYEGLNGRLGEDLIARLGMGIGYKGPWGTSINGKSGTR